MSGQSHHEVSTPSPPQWAPGHLGGLRAWDPGVQSPSNPASWGWGGPRAKWSGSKVQLVSSQACCACGILHGAGVWCTSMVSGHGMCACMCVCMWVSSARARHTSVRVHVCGRAPRQVGAAQWEMPPSNGGEVSRCLLPQTQLCPRTNRHWGTGWGRGGGAGTVPCLDPRVPPGLGPSHLPAAAAAMAPLCPDAWVVWALGPGGDYPSALTSASPMHLVKPAWATALPSHLLLPPPPWA